jgi:hypothetical protein
MTSFGGNRCEDGLEIVIKTARQANKIETCCNLRGRPFPTAIVAGRHRRIAINPTLVIFINACHKLSSVNDVAVSYLAPYIGVGRCYFQRTELIS